MDSYVFNSDSTSSFIIKEITDNIDDLNSVISTANEDDNQNDGISDIFIVSMNEPDVNNIRHEKFVSEKNVNVNNDIIHIVNNKQYDQSSVDEFVIVKPDDPVKELTNTLQNDNTVDSSLALPGSVIDIKDGSNSIGTENTEKYELMEEFLCFKNKDSGNDKHKYVSKTRSMVWKYFTKESAKKVKCSICFNEISYCKSTSPLLRHLRNKHKDLVGDDCLTMDEEQLAVSTEVINKKPIVIKNKQINCLWKYFTKLKLNKAKCNFCLKIFSCRLGFSNLLQHTYVRHKNYIKRYWLPLIYRKMKLNAFFMKLHPNKMKCNLCQKIFPSQKSRKLIYHLQLKHKLTKNIKLHYKNIKQSQKSENKIKNKKSNSNKEIDFTNTPLRMSTHFTRCNYNKIKCKICSAIFIYSKNIKSDLKYHLKLKHKNVLEENKIPKLSENMNPTKLDEIYKDDILNTQVEIEFNIFSKMYFTILESNIICNICFRTSSDVNNIHLLLCHLKYEHNLTFDLTSPELENLVKDIDFKAFYQEISKLTIDSAEFVNENPFCRKLKKVEKEIKYCKINYFTNYHSKKMCKLCHKQFSKPKENTNRLLLHLKFSHDITLNFNIELLYNSYVKDSFKENFDNQGNDIVKIRQTEPVMTINRVQKLTETYFTILESQIVCNLCFIVSNSPKNTYNLLCHLKYFHNVAFDFNLEKLRSSFNDLFKEVNSNSDETGIDTLDEEAELIIGDYSEDDRTYKNEVNKLEGMYFITDSKGHKICNLCSKIVPPERYTYYSLCHLKFDHDVAISSDLQERYEIFPSGPSQGSKQTFLKKEILCEEIAMVKKTLITTCDHLSMCNICFKVSPAPNNTYTVLCHLKYEHDVPFNFNMSQTCIVMDESVNALNCEGKGDKSESEYQCEIANEIKNDNKEFKNVWQYLKKYENSKFHCNICDRISPKYKSRYNLLNHLCSTHKINSDVDLEKFSASLTKGFFTLNNDINNDWRKNTYVEYSETSAKINDEVEKLKVLYFSKSESKVVCNLCFRTNPCPKNVYVFLCHLIYVHDIKLNFNLEDFTISQHHLINDVSNQESVHSFSYPSLDKNTTTVDECKENRKLEMSESWKSKNQEELNDISNSDNDEIEKLKCIYFNNVGSKLMCKLCFRVSPTTDNSNVLLCHLKYEHGVKVTSIEEDSCDNPIHDFNGIPNETDRNEVEDRSQISDRIDNDLETNSKVWDYFTKQPTGKVICSICSRISPFPKSTYNLVGHLKYTHNIIIDFNEEQSQINNKEDSLENCYTSEFVIKTENVSENSLNEDDCSSSESESTSSESSQEADSDSSAEMMKTVRTWRYFTKFGREYVKCNLCNKSFSFSVNLTNILNYHLRKLHKDDIFEKNVKSTSKILINSFEKQTKNKKPRNSNIVTKTNKNVSIRKNMYNKSLLTENFTEISDTEVVCNICNKKLFYKTYNLSRHMYRLHRDVYNLKANEPNTFVRRPVSNSTQKKSHKNSTGSNKKLNVYHSIRDEKLKSCTKLESNYLKCIFCSKIFCLEGINNLECTVKLHMQIHHAKWEVICCDDDIVRYQNSKSMSFEEYDELGEIENEVNLLSSNLSEMDEIVTPDKLEKTVNEIIESDMKSNDNDSNEEEEGENKIWNYFIKVNNFLASCNFCDKSLKYSNKRNDNLLKHLRSVHFCVYQSYYGILPSGYESSIDGNSKENVIDENIDCCDSRLVTGESAGTPSLRRIGRTWSHFTKTDMGKASCNICNKIILYSGTGTNILNYHLSKKHSDYFCDSSNEEPPALRNNITEDNLSDQDNGLEYKDSNNLSKYKSKNKVWKYYTKLNENFAKCQLCMTNISCRGNSNLIRHLQRIHSVLSLPNPVLEDNELTDEPEKSQLLAGLHLAPKKTAIQENKKRVCFTELGKNIVKCNFCSKIISHKNGNIHKLTSHLQNKHCNEIIRYNSQLLKNINVDGEEPGISTLDDHPLMDPLTSTESEYNVIPDSKKRSETWLYYTKLNNHYAKCNICNNALSYKGGSIFNLTRHLFIKHGIKFVKPLKVYSKLQHKNLNVIPKSVKICKNKRETLSFFKRINRYLIKCKLCLKRFTYKGVNINRLINHLWSVHITRLIGFSPVQFNTMRVNLTGNDKTVNNVVTMSECINERNQEGRKVSSTWKYFTKLNNCKARCNVCLRFYSFKSGNISNLSRHLERNHNIKLFSTSSRVTKSKTDQQNSDGKEQESVALETHTKTINKKNKKEQFKIPFTVAYNKKINEDNSKREIWKYFIKINDEIQCNVCLEKLPSEKSLLSDLKKHLHLKHEIRILPYDHPLVLMGRKNDETTNTEPFENISESDNLIDSYISNLSSSFRRKIKSTSVSKFKCKLCYLDFLVCNKKYNVLIEHLKSVHLKDLQEEDRIILEKIINKDVSVKTELVKLKENFLESSDCSSNNFFTKTHSFLRYFKNLKMYKAKCKICHKFVSNKIHCNHSITNDLWIKYRTKRARALQSSNKWNNGEPKSKQLKSLRINKIKHFMDVNLFKNLCGSCKVISQSHIRYCNHTLNQWLSGKDQTEQITVEADAQILNENSENNIIIITTDNDEISNEDITYHILNSDNEIDDDVKVIIYKYNSGEHDNNQIKIEEESLENASNDQQSNKALADHIKAILDQINNSADLIGNREPNKEINNTDESRNHSVDKLSVRIENSVSDSSASFALPSMPELQERKIKNASFDNGNARSDGHSGIVNEGLEKIENENKVNLNNITSGDNIMSEKLVKFERSTVTESNHTNSTACVNECTNNKENTANISDLEIINMEETPDKDKPVQNVDFLNDKFEIPAGVYLQKLIKLHKTNKNLIHFSNINYEYRMAKCNICKTYVSFNCPVIYNLLSHLYTKHKNVICDDKVKKRNNEKICNEIKVRKKSPVWKYFINDVDSRAICKICRLHFSYKGGAINNLGRHLRLRHDIVVSTKNDDSINLDDLEDVSMETCYPIIPRKRPAVKLRSKTWKYFSKEPNDWARCNLCKKYLSYRSSTINNLTRHLRTVHSPIYESLFNSDESEIKVEIAGTTDDAVTTPNDDIFNHLLVESTKSRDEVLQACSHTSDQVPNSKRKSLVWNYFTELSHDSGKCNFCSKVISCKGGGTSNLSRHLRVKHGVWIVSTSNLRESFRDLQGSNKNQSNINVNMDTEVCNETFITQEQLHILKRKFVSRKSKTWDYFMKVSADKVMCNLCSKMLSYKCKAVHNLRRHLQIKHPECCKKPENLRLKLQISSVNEIEPTEVIDPEKNFIDITDTNVILVDDENQPPPARSCRSVRPKKSFVWNYFEEVEYGVAKCYMCSRVLSFRGGGTNNLTRHLRIRHAIPINDLQNEPTQIPVSDEMAETAHLLVNDEAQTMQLPIVEEAQAVEYNVDGKTETIQLPYTEEVKAAELPVIVQPVQVMDNMSVIDNNTINDSL